MDNLYVDEPVFVSFHIGELGHFLQRFQGLMRWLRNNKYKDRKFLIMARKPFHIFIRDFTDYITDLPVEFYKLNLETDCSESPLKSAPPGSLTPPDVYNSLIEYLRSHYNKDKAIEFWPSRGCDFFWIDHKPQTFVLYKTEKIESDLPIICVFPRGRARASFRNVPDFVWDEVVDKLSEQFLVVLGGTPDGSYLANKEGKNIINLISYDGDDKLEQIMVFLNSCICSVSSQSGLTHVSMLCGANSYIIGHEKYRHAVVENRYKVPVSFRFVDDYRAIDAYTILKDIEGFINDLLSKGIVHLGQLETNVINRPALQQLVGKKDLVGVEIGVDEGYNSKNILDNLDVKKLYLVDPWKPYDQFKKQESHYQIAKKILADYSDKVVWLRMTSDEAVDKIPNELDFVYIDGNHRYEFVKDDIENYLPKVREGGLLAGHDYEFSEVHRAVNEILKKDYHIYSGKSLDCNPYDWWIFKGENEFDKIINSDIEKLKTLWTL